MKRTYYFSLIGCLLNLVCELQAQPVAPVCNPLAPKIKFSGSAPSPWAIDGNVIDWETILGPGSGNPLFYYAPPAATGFNWSVDGARLGHNNHGEIDNPEPHTDLRFFSFIHDDYNVYFYLRKMKKSNDLISVYYFCDINTDGYMDTGEPVFKVVFNSNNISSLSVCRYIVNTENPEYYFPGHGNPINGDCFVNGYSMPGNVEELFNSTSIPFDHRLELNELFSAAVTEKGFGVEFALPWKYLKNWTTGSIPLLPGYIFYYHIASQGSSGDYQADSVSDNAGSCFSNSFIYGTDVAFSGPPEAQLLSSSVTTLVNGLSYRFKLTYFNPTNAPEEISIGQSILIKEIIQSQGLTINEQQFSINAYADINCNGEIDPNEDTVPYYYNSGTLNQQPIIYTKRILGETTSTLVPPFENVCFIVDISLPPNFSVQSAFIELTPDVKFSITQSCFQMDGGKPINPVGFTVEDEIAVSRVHKESIGEMNSNYDGLYIYPNPASGSTNVIFPGDWGIVDMMLTDFSGKAIQKWSGLWTRNVNLIKLTPGVYLLKLRSRDGKKIATKKLIIR